MSRLTTLASLAFVLGTASVAWAGGTYVSAGIGGEPAVSGDMDGAIAGEGDGGNGRLALGLGVGQVGLEGSLSRFAFGLGDATAAGAHLRVGVPIAGAFGGYARVGVERVWLGTEGDRIGEDSASGIAGALGMELRLETPLIGQAGIWAEVSQDRFTTEMGTGGVRLWTAGVLIGL